MIVFCMSLLVFIFVSSAERKNQMHVMLCHLFGSIVVQDVFNLIYFTEEILPESSLVFCVLHHVDGCRVIKLDKRLHKS